MYTRSKTSGQPSREHPALSLSVLPFHGPANLKARSLSLIKGTRFDLASIICRFFYSFYLCLCSVLCDFSFRLRFLEGRIFKEVSNNFLSSQLRVRIVISKFYARWGWKFHRGRFIREEGLSFGSRFRFWPTFDSVTYNFGRGTRKRGSVRFLSKRG